MSDIPVDVPGPTLDEAYRLDTPDAELYFELVGPPDAPPIFYLHGGPGYNSHSFRDLVGDELADYRMIYADQRGAGRSLADTGVNLGVEAVAGDTFAILDALRIPKVTLLAHGFGAMVAVAAAQSAPERIERLILANPWVDMPELAKTLQLEAARLSGASLSEDDLEELPPADRVAEAVREGGGKGLFDTLLFLGAGSRMRLEHADAEGFADLQESTLTESWQDLWELSPDLEPLRALAHPTVVVLGRQDRSSYPRQAERVLSSLPHALASLLDTAHYPWLDDPDAFIDILNQAMQLLPRAS